MSSLLSTIHSPADLRQLSRPQLAPLADELRSFLLDSVARTGGHLGSNLGTVELTVALPSARSYSPLPLSTIYPL